MFQSMSLITLLGIFAAAAAAIWLAGVKLSDTTDVLAQRFGLGQALGGERKAEWLPCSPV